MTLLAHPTMALYETRDDAVNITATAPEKFVRNLLPRAWSYMVPTALVAAYVGGTIKGLRAQHSTSAIAAHVLRAHSVEGAASGTTVAQLAMDIQRALETSTDPRTDVSRTVMGVLQRSFGQQMKVHGWIPGHRIVENGDLLVVTGDGCPACTINPQVVDEDGYRSCLNHDDCGWEA